MKKIKVNSNNIEGEEKLFHREVQSLLRIIEHPNVVRFLGFCFHTHLEAKESTRAEKRHVVEIRERLLCFEYISNGSLEKYITGTTVLNFMQPLLTLILNDTAFIFREGLNGAACPDIVQGSKGHDSLSGVLEIDFQRLVSQETAFGYLFSKDLYEIYKF